MNMAPTLEQACTCYNWRPLAHCNLLQLIEQELFYFVSKHDTMVINFFERNPIQMCHSGTCGDLVPRNF